MHSENATRMGSIHRNRYERRKQLKLAFVLACSFCFTIWAFGMERAAAQSRNQAGGNVRTEMVHYSSGGDSIDAFLAIPSGAGKHPAVIVIHDVQGLDENTQEIAHRFAEAGFVALAPDFLSRAGGTANKTGDEVAQAFGGLSISGSVEDAKGAFRFLQQRSDVDAGRISSIGIGWGGWRTFKMAEDLPTLYRAVVFYGSTPRKSRTKHSTEFTRRF